MSSRVNALRWLAGRNGRRAALTVGAVLALGACTTNRGQAPDVPDVPPDGEWIRHLGPVTSKVVHIESSVGELAAVLAFPDSAKTARFREGAPVCVVVPDGFDGGTVEAGFQGSAPDGIVTIALALPGGHAAGVQSGGTFDYRGDTCLQALRDAIRFAHGELSGLVEGSSTPGTLDAMIPYPVLADEITVLGLGNGGNLATITFARYSASLSGLANYIAWEVPGSDRYVMGDLGSAAAADAGLTSHYDPGSCGHDSCLVDYGNLKIDLSKLDQPTDPRTGFAVPVSGTIYFDDDGNGVLNGKEMPLHPIIGPAAGSSRAYYSLETARSIEGRELRLSIMADTTATQQFWADRDPTKGSPNSYAQAGAAINPLRVMVLGSAQDHSQGTVDHPHIVREIAQWMSAGSPWVRLNPDVTYMVEAGAVPGTESPANATVGFSTVVPLLLPEEADVDEPLARRAAVMEMADRLHYDRWDADLDSLLVTTEP